MLKDRQKNNRKIEEAVAAFRQPSLTRHCPSVIIKIGIARDRAAPRFRQGVPVAWGAARHPIILFKEERTMADLCGNLHVGDQVPDFEMETFDPVRKDFGRISLKKLKAAKKWTVLFFYPADFTFV
jgi:hypothetical protein